MSNFLVNCVRKYHPASSTGEKIHESNESVIFEFFARDPQIVALEQRSLTAITSF